MTETLTIREMCDAFNVTPRTLRFYEAKELLSPIRQGQKRLFTRRDRARLKLILRGKRFGLSLEEIRQILDLYRPDGDPHPQLREACAIGERHLDRMIAQRAALDEAILELEQQLATGRTQIAELEAAKRAAE
ncbi:MerR family transcriptional regulator [Meridianimarinicoccus roseus]|uniref:MerR family transcriptional regulator n=1 Tax=Meridianimarinicoccus roseus TaxID=2072018 RepID=A0A2V2L7Q7_9RHOB|nr:MerR family DNA-binding transcriptional regulator [Meridianimarinicoccus roseus]PWR01498.1 MerR family transcriptional regulator [Meridianimarinicoccus roseus]